MWCHRRADRDRNPPRPKQPRPVGQNATRAGDGNRDDRPARVNGRAERPQPKREQTRPAHERALRKDHQSFAVAQPFRHFVGARQPIAQSGFLNRDVSGLPNRRADQRVSVNARLATKWNSAGIAAMRTIESI